MNRDVLRRQMFARGGVAYPMQNGGMAPAPLPADPGPMPAPAPMPPMDPGNADMGQVAQAAMQNGVDPAMLEAMLTQYASGLDDLENAQDYETVMNGIRGDQQPIQQRYQELANVVGPEDAQQTPESVLTLVQPVMMMASVDQGIGSLAAEQMAAPVQGPMAEGIMSTVDMPAPEPEPMAAPAPMAGGPDPVNFNQGGEVQYFADGGVALPQNPLYETYKNKLPVYQQILGVEDREKAFQDQKNMTQAQMLFDIAQGALMFATPGERNMSPAERLAQSFTPVLGNIGARAGELQKFKQSQAEQDRALRLQALGSAEQTLAARRAVEAQEAAAKESADLQIRLSGDQIRSRENIAKMELDAATEARISQQAHQLLMQANTFKHEKSQTESNQDFQSRLADRKSELQLQIQELSGEQNEKAIQLRSHLQGQLAKVDHAHEKELQKNKFDFDARERLDTQAYQDEVREQQLANQRSIIALNYDNSEKAREHANRLEKEQARLASELRITENELSFENQLERDGRQNNQRILEMDKGFEQNQALVEFKAAIDEKSRRDRNEFEAAQKALDRAHEENRQAYDRNTQIYMQGFRQSFKQRMQEDMQKFTKDQNEIERAIRKAELAFRKATAGDQLKIDEARLALEEEYKLGRLALDRQAAKAAKLGSEATTNELTYFTGERLEAYGNGRLNAEEERVFEQALLHYTAIKGDVWDPDLGEHIKARNLLAPGVLEVVKKRNPALFEQITGPRPDDRLRDTLGSATIELFNLSKAGRPVSVNPESSIWKNAPTTLFKPELAKKGMYREVVGLSRVFGGLGAGFDEFLNEFFGGDYEEYTKQRKQAQADLRTFANRLLNYQTGEDQGGRVLKFVQLLMAEETDKMRAGGIFRTDADARATIEAIRGQLEQTMMRNANILPEYGGATKFDKKSVLKARRDMVELKTLYNELLGFQEGFEVMPDPVTRAVKGRDQSTEHVHEQISRQRNNPSSGGVQRSAAANALMQMNQMNQNQ